MPLEQILVQSNHASHEGALKYPYTSTEPNSLIVIGVKNKAALEKALERYAHFDPTPFYEPDWDYGLTAFTTRPVTAEERAEFRKYQLFRGSHVRN